jgi:Flp pilus assembly protein TadG
MRALWISWRKLIGDRSGAAAVEFVLVAPIMVAIFFGAVELSNAVTVQRKVAQVAGATGDLVARADKTIAVAEVTDIMLIGSYLLDPATQTPLRVVISNVTSSATDAKDTKETWRCEFVGGTKQTTCTCPNSKFALPRADLVAANDSVLVAKATYAYKPMGFGEIIPSEGMNFSVTRYLKPRTQSAKLRFANNTVC